jgi:glycosyltransferase involved in cell wall biosynthesis
VPVVFTAAPDPHAVLEAADRDGTVTRTGFGETDSLEHWWFRARMVERLVGQAAGVALLPRADAAGDLRRLGVDVPARARVIPEGVHAATVRDAAVTAAAGTAVRDLRAHVGALPAWRRELPSVVTAGRLHPSKGMDRIARAWADDAVLHTGTNLVIVGGDLERPSPDELDVLLAIEDAVHGDTDGVILLGHRPHAELARLFADASGGTGAIYVAGSRKEEFGLAIVEAMAAGLVVVAPSTGGPSTYVVEGVDGYLVDTGVVGALADGMRSALQLVAVPGRAAATSARILGAYTIEAMASRLVDLYTEVAEQTRRRASCAC